MKPIDVAVLTDATRAADDRLPPAALARALGAAGCACALATSVEAVQTQAPELVALDFFAEGMSPHDRTDSAAYADEVAPLVARLDARRVVLFDSPRGLKSLDLAVRLGLAATIDDHDLWVGLSPSLLGEPPYQSGINGRTESLVRIGCEIEREQAGYAKVRVRPFASLAELVVAYLRQLRA